MSRSRLQSFVETRVGEVSIAAWFEAFKKDFFADFYQPTGKMDENGHAVAALKTPTLAMYEAMLDLIADVKTVAGLERKVQVRTCLDGETASSITLRAVTNTFLTNDMITVMQSFLQTLRGECEKRLLTNPAYYQEPSLLGLDEKRDQLLRDGLRVISSTQKAGSTYGDWRAAIAKWNALDESRSLFRQTAQSLSIDQSPRSFSESLASSARFSFSGMSKKTLSNSGSHVDVNASLDNKLVSQPGL